MKQLNTRTGSSMRHGRQLFLTALLSGGTLGAWAQFTEETTYSHDSYNLKNYAATILPGSGRTAMAGTIFNPLRPSDNSIHYMTMDHSTSPPAMLLDMQYNDIDYDERPVGVHFVNNTSDDVAIVASRMWVQPAPPGGLDKIEILRVKADGTFYSTTEISSPIYNIYPMGTLADGNDLYICGYVSTTNISLPQSSKSIFILKYDLQSNSVITSTVLDYGTGGSVFDYDMAMRMKMLRSGNIYVTGSCNAQNASSGNWYCGTLSLVIDGSLNVQSDKPFSYFASTGQPGSNADYFENGFDIQDDPFTGGYFIFGNFGITGLNNPTPMPEFLTITYVDANFDPQPNNRYMFQDFDYAWGVNLLENNVTGQALLFGYETNRWDKKTYSTSMENVNPFIARYDLRYAGGRITAKPLSWSTVLSDKGTGIMTDPNRFHVLGDWHSCVAWGPAGAVRDLSVSRDILLSTPIWGSNGNNKLNIKVVRTDENGELRGCPYDNTGLPKDYLFKAPASTLFHTPVMTNFATASVYFTEADALFPPDATYTCTNDGVFRPTGISEAVSPATGALTVAPNPAHDLISITPEGKPDREASFTVTLTDMTGRKVADLYNGARAGLNHIALPGLTAGVYLVQLHTDGHLAGTRKLVIR